MINIGNRLKALRESKNMSQTDLAKKLGKSQVAISKYENGNRQLDYEMLVRYAEYFGVSTDYLLGRVNEKNGYLISGDAYPKVMRPFLKDDSSITLVVDKPDINATDKEKRALVEECLRNTKVDMDGKNDFSAILSALPLEIRNKPRNLYELLSIAGSNENYMNALKQSEIEESGNASKNPQKSAADNATAPSVSIEITDSMIRNLNTVISEINNIEKMAGKESIHSLIKDGYQLKSEILNSTLFPDLPKLDKDAKTIIDRIRDSKLPVEKKQDMLVKFNNTLDNMKNSLTAFTDELKKSIDDAKKED